MSGAGRGEPKGSYHRDGTAASRAFYGEGPPEPLADILAEHGYVLDSPGMPVVDARGRRVGGRPGVLGIGRTSASWNRADHEAIHGEIGGEE